MRVRNGRRCKKRYVFFICILLCTLLFVVQFREKILDSAVKLAKNIAIETVYRAVSDWMESRAISYDELICTSVDHSGNITKMSANAPLINVLKSETILQVKEAMKSQTVQHLSVPLGTLSGITMLSGYGPSIPCRVLMSSVPQVSLQYHFDGAGINQTLHSIIMTVKVPLSVTMPLQDRDTEVSCSFLIGETVLVGRVPDGYTNVISDPEVADDIFNYGDAY